MLRIDNVTKSLGGLTVLDRLSLEVEKGEIVALIGPSGCGKTTLLNLVSDLMQPDSGKIEKGAGKLSYMFQNSRLLPWRTVYRNIQLGRPGSTDGEIRTIIKAVGLEGFEDYYPTELSGGMAKRVALARAFFRGGDYLLMDEPFQALDYALRMEMIGLLLSIWRKDRPGVLFVTHEIDEALMVATRLALLSRRPATVADIIDLPGKEGRSPSDPALQKVRERVIQHIKPDKEGRDGKV